MSHARKTKVRLSGTAILVSVLASYGGGGCGSSEDALPSTPDAAKRDAKRDSAPGTGGAASGNGGAMGGLDATGGLGTGGTGVGVGSGGTGGGMDAGRDGSSDLATGRLDVGTALDTSVAPEVGAEVQREVAGVDGSPAQDVPLPPSDGARDSISNPSNDAVGAETQGTPDVPANKDVGLLDVPADLPPKEDVVFADLPPKADVADARPAASCTNPGWAKGYAGLKLGGGIAVDKDGNLFHANAVNPTGADFGGAVGTVTSAGDSDAVIAKFDPATGGAAWAKPFGDTSAQTAVAVAVDQSGHLAFIGDYQGSMKLKSSEISNPGAFPFAWVGGLQASDGSALWALSARLSLDEGSAGGLFAIAANPNQDDFVVCGKANVAATDLNVAGKPALTAAGDGKYDIVVAKIKGSDGTLVWSRQIGGTGDQSCTAAAIDDNGNVFVAGIYSGQLDFGNGALPVPGNGSWLPWIAKLNKDTGATTATMSPTAGTGTTRGYVYGMDTDSAGNVAIAGKFTNAMTFGATTLTSVGLLDAYVAKLGGDLVPSWAKRWGDAKNQTANAVAFDSSGALTVVGAFLGTIDIAPSGAILTAASDASGSNEDVFVARLSGTSGDSLCAAGYGDPASQVANSVAVSRSASGTNQDGTFIGGAFKQGSVLDFNTPSTALTSPVAGSGSDFWVAKF